MNRRSRAFVLAAVCVAIGVSCAGWYHLRYVGPWGWNSTLHGCPDQATWDRIEPQMGYWNAVKLSKDGIEEFVVCWVGFDADQRSGATEYPKHLRPGTDEFDAVMKQISDRPREPERSGKGVNCAAVLPPPVTTLARTGSRFSVVTMPQSGCSQWGVHEPSPAWTAP